MTEHLTFKPGDRVRHEKRPEWGIGHIKRVENTRIGDKDAQRLTINFPNGGLKTLSTLGAVLSIVDGPSGNGHNSEEGETLLEKEETSESGWLGEISNDNPEDAMTQLPTEATDPFASSDSRLKATLNLYRFNSDGGSLIDWAVARSGLDDPLSRFNRHELEQFFDRWCFIRDQHLGKCLEDYPKGHPVLEKALDEAPPAARRAIGRARRGGR